MARQALGDVVRDEYHLVDGVGEDVLQPETRRHSGWLVRIAWWKRITSQIYETARNETLNSPWRKQLSSQFA